jgi:hypothetical protein
MNAIRFERCKRTDPRYVAIRNRHYVPNNGACGRQLHYVIWYREEIVGVISGGSSAFGVKLRDEFFGLDLCKSFDEYFEDECGELPSIRNGMLGAIINNTIFRLEMHEDNLATRILACWRRQVGKKVCSGPPFDCPGQPGYERVFSENNSEETVCTNADSVDIGENGKCPTGYYHSSIAQPPYNDLCVGRRPPTKQNLTPEEQRISIAEHAQLQSEQLLPERKWKEIATGVGKRTLKISMPSVSENDLSGLFHGGMAYAEWLYENGFRMTVVTDGHQYWAAPLSQDGYHEVDGPYDKEPTLGNLASLRKVTAAQSSGERQHVATQSAKDNPLSRTPAPSTAITSRQQFAEELTERMSNEIWWCAGGREGELLAGYVTTSHLSPGTSSQIATASPLWKELYRKGFRFTGVFDRDENTKTAAITADGGRGAPITAISDQNRAYLEQAIYVLMRKANGVEVSGGCIPSAAPAACPDGQVRQFIPSVGYVCTSR